MVVRSQRERILRALADTVFEGGYAASSVAQVLKRAQVSRETFYEQFRSKEDCFEAAFEWAMALLTERVVGALDEHEDNVAKLSALLHAYFDELAADPARARLFLVEVHAAGPRMSQVRGQIQDRFIDFLAPILQPQTERQVFACRTLVAAISSMATTRVATGDFDGLSGLAAPLLDMVRHSGDFYGAGVGTPP